MSGADRRATNRQLWTHAIEGWRDCLAASREDAVHDDPDIGLAQLGAAGAAAVTAQYARGAREHYPNADGEDVAAILEFASEICFRFAYGQGKVAADLLGVHLTRKPMKSLARQAISLDLIASGGPLEKVAKKLGVSAKTIERDADEAASVHADARARAVRKPPKN